MNTRRTAPADGFEVTQPEPIGTSTEPPPLQPSAFDGELPSLHVIMMRAPIATSFRDIYPATDIAAIEAQTSEMERSWSLQTLTTNARNFGVLITPMILGSVVSVWGSATAFPGLSEFGGIMTGLVTGGLLSGQLNDMFARPGMRQVLVEDGVTPGGESLFGRFAQVLAAPTALGAFFYEAGRRLSEKAVDPAVSATAEMVYQSLSTSAFWAAGSHLVATGLAYLCGKLRSD